jgi:hypothetical protein
MIADKCRLWLLVLLILAAVPVMAQRNKAQLQKEKQQNLDKIKETEKILSETSQQKKAIILKKNGAILSQNKQIILLLLHTAKGCIIMGICT